MTKKLIFAYATLIVGCTAPFASRVGDDDRSVSAGDPSGKSARTDDAPLIPDGGAPASKGAPPAGSGGGGGTPADGGASDADSGTTTNTSPGVAASLIDVYRAFNASAGDHLQGLVANEGAPDWAPEGVGFRIYADGAGGRATLYRCRVNNTAYHFLSTAGNCEGQAVEGPLGYLAASGSDGTSPVPLYRCVLGNDHLSTLDSSECQAAGFVVEGQMGSAFR